MKQFADTMAQNRQTDTQSTVYLYQQRNTNQLDWSKEIGRWAEKQDSGWYLPAKSKADLNTARCSMQKEATVERNIGSREQK